VSATADGLDAAPATRVVLLDSGGANLGSVQSALGRLGLTAPVTSDWATIRAATHVLLPGVGAAGAAMARLRDTGLDRLIPTLPQPLLGICIGMQLLFEHSEEGDTDCLGLLPGTVRRLPPAPGIRVPHMGWNRLRVRANDPLVAGLDDAWVYFVHGYAAADGADAVASATHGGGFAAVVRRGNVMGAQFHPERSAAAGRRLLRNFLAL
jgi:imidazole glycerol-phosphate synthase subunit HisH